MPSPVIPVAIIAAVAVAAVCLMMAADAVGDAAKNAKEVVDDAAKNVKEVVNDAAKNAKEVVDIGAEGAKEVVYTTASRTEVIPGRAVDGVLSRILLAIGLFLIMMMAAFGGWMIIKKVVIREVRSWKKRSHIGVQAWTE